MSLDDIFDEVQEIVSHLGARIYGEVESFLAKQVIEIPGTKQEVLDSISLKASEWFRSAAELPEWIQDAKWPAHDGKPMIFLGQIAIHPNSGLFHDEAAAYVFMCGESGVTTTIIQVA